MDTIYTIPSSESPNADIPNYVARDTGSTDYNYPYLLRNHKFAFYSNNTMKNQKNK